MGQRLTVRNYDDGAIILVGDDEEAMRHVLNVQLSARGHSVYEAGTGADILQTVSKLEPDVILLDLGLPDIDGIEVTQRLRRSTQTPIIVLSARVADFDKIAALDAGADDYLTKPYQPSELFERIRTALLRTTIQGESVFEAGDLVVDLSCQTVRIGNNQIQLADAEYQLLKVLVLNASKLMTQRHLASDVWGRHDNEALHLLRTTIGSLRQKLETDPVRPRHIATESGVGFRLRTDP
jgi:two-component system, OmpR family, KDP operon response regulator KdpE